MLRDDFFVRVNVEVALLTEGGGGGLLLVGFSSGSELKTL